jgi:integrase
LGIDPVVRKEMLGHNSLRMTDDVYGHTTPKMHKDAAGELDHFFSKEK